MTVEASLFTALRAIVSDRCYPLAFPLSPPRPQWPAIRYTLVSTVPAAALCGDTGDEGSDFRVQIDCVAQTFVEVRTTRLLVIAAMASFAPPAVLQNTSSLFDPETATYTESVEYLIHASTASV